MLLGAATLLLKWRSQIASGSPSQNLRALLECWAQGAQLESVNCFRAPASSPL